MKQTIQFDADLIRKYDKSGPRYTSYPTAVQFHDGFTAAEYAQWAERSNARGNPLSVYIHVPFCATVCYYCACNKIITANRQRAVPYLERLHREIALQGELLDRSRPVTQLHWGGGTPTFINHQQMTDLMDRTRQSFQLLDDDAGEYSIELDPREIDADGVALLRELGFNRVSLGVQDFEPEVQQAVNRIQTAEQTEAVMNAARHEGFSSVSIDLMYGLPHQTMNSFNRTLDRIISLSPDRVSVFNYAHLPQLFKTQRQIDENTLPAPADKLAILESTIDRLVGAGYLYIGMDHFAKPDDELAVAQREGLLYRNFQGYSTHSNCDLVGMGSTAIGMIGETYSQNERELEGYYASIDRGQVPVFRGVELDRDDRLRRAVITRLICGFELSFAAIEKEYSIDFDDYFATELADLPPMVDDGLIELCDTGILVQPAGRLLIRNICMVFDRYLRQQENKQFSKVI